MTAKKTRKKKTKVEAKTETATTDPRVGELEEELERLQREASDSADRALRTLAEFDNYRKRSRRERDAAAENGKAQVLTRLLDVADNFDRALEHAGEDVPESFLEGMRLVARGLHEVLGRNEVVRIDAEGAPFDPEVHEALTSQPSAEAEPNTVLQEIQPGYRMGDRVLRPAKVIVAMAPPNEPPPSADGDESSS